MRTNLYFAMMMVEQGDADGVLSGVSQPYPVTIRPGLEVIGLAEGKRRVAGMYMMLHRRGILFFGDTTVNTAVDSESLADIAEMLADAARTFEVEPRVAMLSYSNFGSARGSSSEMVSRAVEILRARRPEIEVEGEMQANVAVDYTLQKMSFPFTRLSGPANVLVFPNLESGNVSYKLMRELGGVPAVGPVLLGMKKPVTVLERDSTVETIVHMAALTVVEAQQQTVPRQAELPLG
jgi:malate dehydrogenase (oxaloacetate-decarboxylating)(NADP+)